MAGINAFRNALRENRKDLAFVPPCGSRVTDTRQVANILYREEAPLGIAGMILGIVAVVFAFIPVVGAFISFPCIAVGIPLSALGLRKNIREETGRGMSIAGLATCCVALVIVIIWLVALGSAVDDALSDINSPSQSTQQNQEDPIDVDCKDFMADYRVMVTTVGHDAAVMHVSNVLNAQNPGRYVSVSDAEWLVQQCG